MTRVRHTESSDITLGFRVKSGWAVAVLLTGPANFPGLLERREVLLSDPAVPESKQPYHPALGLPADVGERVTRRLRKVVKRAAVRSVRALLTESNNSGRAVRAAGMVVGSLVNPASLHNDHIRAHGLEGQLFRTALEDALRSQRIRCEVMVEKTAYSAAAQILRCTEGKAKRVVAALGKTHEGPWRAEEKLASLAAWVALAKRR